MKSLALKFERDGVEIRKTLLSRDIIEFVKSDMDLESEKLRKYGVRNLEKRFDSISVLADSANLLSIAESLLNAPVKLVRALFFDKTPDKNWFVTWHQDKTVTLNKQLTIEGWGLKSAGSDQRNTLEHSEEVQKCVCFLSLEDAFLGRKRELKDRALQLPRLGMVQAVSGHRRCHVRSP